MPDIKNLLQQATVIRDEKKIMANTANRVGSLLVDIVKALDLPGEYLSRLKDDTAEGLITFLKGLVAEGLAKLDGGATFGEFIKGFSGSSIDSGGNAEVESMVSRSYLKVMEVIYNRLNTIEGRTAFADSGTIEVVEPLSETRAVLYMRKRWDGDMTPFQPGDIVYGYVNNLDATDGPSAYEVWAWIERVDHAANTLIISYYPDNEVPSGINHRMGSGMVIARRGNNVEASRETYINPDYSAVVIRDADGFRNVRQDSFYISCEDGNIVGLTGVNRPILDRGNYGTVLGRLPDGLLDPVTSELVNRYQPYLFARGIVVQDLIRIDYHGTVRREANYRGAWVREVAMNPDTCYRSTKTSYDTVTWDGSLWQCLYDGTSDEPGTTGAWLRMTGDAGTEIWTLMPSASTVTLHEDGTATPESLMCVAVRHDAGGDAVFTDSYGLWEEGMKLYYSPDGKDFTDGSGQGGDSTGGNYGSLPDYGNLREFVTGSAEPIETEDGEPIETEDGTVDTVLTVGGDNIDTSTLGNKVVFYLVRDSDRTVVAHAVVGVVRDGPRGEAGIAGQMVYPAGVYDRESLYISTDGTTPVVEYGGSYYVLRRGWTYRGTDMPEDRQTPAGDVAYATEDYPQRWERFDSFKAVFADVLMANFGKLGSAVFFGDWMFSQQGTLILEDGSRQGGSTEYRHFADGSFEPNFSVNLRTGEIRAMSGIFSGYLKTEFKRLDISDVETVEPKVAGSNRAYRIRKDVTLMSYGYAGTTEIVLPKDISYAGTRVTICDYSNYSRNSGSTLVLSEGRGIQGVGRELLPDQDVLYRGAQGISFTNGVAEFVGVSEDFSGDWSGEVEPECVWFLVNVSGSSKNAHNPIS